MGAKSNTLNTRKATAIARHHPKIPFTRMRICDQMRTQIGAELFSEFRMRPYRVEVCVPKTLRPNIAFGLMTICWLYIYIYDYSIHTYICCPHSSQFEITTSLLGNSARAERVTPDMNSKCYYNIITYAARFWQVSGRTRRTRSNTPIAMLLQEFRKSYLRNLRMTMRRCCANFQVAFSPTRGMCMHSRDINIHRGQAPTYSRTTQIRKLQNTHRGGCEFGICLSSSLCTTRIDCSIYTASKCLKGSKRFAFCNFDSGACLPRDIGRVRVFVGVLWTMKHVPSMRWTFWNGGKTPRSTIRGNMRRKVKQTINEWQMKCIDRNQFDCVCDLVIFGLDLTRECACDWWKMGDY